MEWYPQWQDIDSDTIAIAAFVAEAEEPENPKDSVTYRWEVGSEILTTRKISRSIFSGPLPPFIDLKLTVTKKPNKSCNPSDPGIATFSRRIYLAKEFAWVGKWHGFVNDNPADTLTVYIVRGTENSIPIPCRPWLAIGHFPMRDWFSIFDGGVSFYQFGRLDGDACIAPSNQTWGPSTFCYGILNRETRKLTIQSRKIKVENGKIVDTIDLKFTGKKIQE